MTFDAWELPVQPSEDYLMHFRTKGSKNGVRRYQTASGEWTELGLAERRKREGFGESRKERRAAKRLAKAERHQARRRARAEVRAAYAEKKRQRSLKGLTDDELQKKISRLKMEQEYKELNRSPLIKTGTDLVNKVLDYRNNKEQRVIDINRQKIDRIRAQAELVKATSGVKRAREEARKAKFEFKGNKEERRQAKVEKDEKLLKAKMEYKNYTVRGGIGKRINMALTSGKAKKYEAIRKAEGDVEARKINNKYNQKVEKEKARADRRKRNK